MDHILRVGDEAIAAARPAGPPPAPAGPPPTAAQAQAERDDRKIRHVVDTADGLESRPWGCVTGIVIALIAFAATLGITVAVAAVVGGESGPLDTLPKGKPVATTAAPPATTAVPPPTTAAAPASTALPVGGVQPPTEVVPGPVIVPGGDDGNGGEPPPSTHQENPCVSGHEAGC